MKHLKYLNELVKNKLSIKWHLNKALQVLNNKLTQKINKDNIKIDIDNPVYYKIQFLHTDENDHPIWISWLKNLKSSLLKDDIILSYKDYRSPELDFIGDDLEMATTGNFKYDYIVYIKNIHTNRVKPSKYVYHYSNIENRDNILKNGLKIMSHKGSKDWSNEISLEYPDAIFAVNSNTDIWKKGDKWQIDTTKIKNTWWQDLNFKKRPDLVMTFSDIPKDAIKLS